MLAQIERTNISPGLSQESFSKALFWALAGVALIFMLFISRDFGITWDDWISDHYGRLVLRFLATGGAAKECFVFFGVQYLYGALFDAMANLLYGLWHHNLSQMIFSNPPFELYLPYYYESRHFLNACFGWSAMLFAGLLAKELAGWRAASLTFLFLIVTPCFLGHSMNNPKDIPFAAAYIFSIYGMTRFLKAWPRPSFAAASVLALGIAIAVNIRASAAFILFCFLFFFLFVSWLLGVLRQKEFRVPRNTFLKVLWVLGAGYFLGFIFWPYGLIDPIHHPLKGLEELSYFRAAVQGSMLFNGQTVWLNAAPWFYIPVWMLITIPLFVQAGLVLSAIRFGSVLKKIPGRYLLLILMVTVLPVIYAMLRRSILYDSWRHFLFIYPTLVILSVLGWQELFAWFKTRREKILGGLLLMVFAVEPVGWMVRNHPNEYVYFNPWVGGIRGAYGRYETDYWGNGLKQAAQWLASDCQKQGGTGPVRIASDGEPPQVAYYLLRGLAGRYVLSHSKDDADYVIKLSRYLSPEDFRQGRWPPPGTVHTVTVDGVPICAVVKVKKYGKAVPTT